MFHHHFYSYADGIRLYVAISPGTEPQATLPDCILYNKFWIYKNFLHLNQEKSETLIIRSEA